MMQGPTTAAVAGVITLFFALAASAAQEVPQKLTTQHRAVFCGEHGHEEATLAYSSAVAAEVAWRISAGARTSAEALGAMRGEYCGGHLPGAKK